MCYIFQYVNKKLNFILSILLALKGDFMLKLTDYSILEALRQGKTITLNNELAIRELLDGDQGVIYALHEEECLWKPYSPNVWELSQSNWKIENQEPFFVAKKFK